MVVENADSTTSVKTSLNYSVSNGKPVVQYVHKQEASNMPRKAYPVTINNGRLLPQMSLDVQGFTLLREPTAVRDFFDPEQIRNVYHRETKSIVKRLTGATTVLIMNEVIRTEDEGRAETQRPAQNAHVDITLKTMRDFIPQYAAPESVDSLRAGRMMLINIWRPLRTTVERWPLALCDARSVSTDDLDIGVTKLSPDDQTLPVWEGYGVKHNPAHRWYYWPHMEPDEILVFKQCDSDVDRPQLTAHTAFDLPDVRPDAPTRESIEIRAIACFGA